VIENGQRARHVAAFSAFRRAAGMVALIYGRVA
jgi:hypothetical protein